VDAFVVQKDNQGGCWKMQRLGFGVCESKELFQRLQELEELGRGELQHNAIDLLDYAFKLQYRERCLFCRSSDKWLQMVTESVQQVRVVAQVIQAMEDLLAGFQGFSTEDEPFERCAGTAKEVQADFNSAFHQCFQLPAGKPGMAEEKLIELVEECLNCWSGVVEVRMALS